MHDRRNKTLLPPSIAEIYYRNKKMPYYQWLLLFTLYAKRSSFPKIRLVILFLKN